MSQINRNEIKLSAGNQTIVVRARQEGRGTLFERESHSSSKLSGQVRFTQVFVADKQSIARFVSAEPHSEVQEAIATLVASSPLLNESLIAEGKRDGIDAFQIIGDIARADDETELIGTITDVIKLLGAETCFFFLIEKGADELNQSHRVIASSNPEVMQRYVNNNWYATDPYLTHAANSHAAIFSSDLGRIEGLTGSQREMAEHARLAGMRSWIVMPAHSPDRRFFGALYAANSDLPSDNGEQPLRKNRLAFSLLAKEVFEWYERKEKAFARKSSGLLPLDIKILEEVRRGCDVKQIAGALDLTQNALRTKYLPEICKKLNASNKNEAAAIAYRNGFLAIASARKIAYVIYSSQYGIYLCTLWNYPCWSKIEPSEIYDAQAFPDEESAQQFLDSLNIPSGHDCVLRRVDVHHSAWSATIKDCADAGLPAWNPTTPTTSGHSPDNLGTPAGVLESPTKKAWH